VTWLFGWTVLLAAGAVIVEPGALASVDALAATSPDCSVAGCAPMSARRLSVACCMRTSAAPLPRSWFESSPHDHWTVPAPNTRAPLGAR
jgi:hypothetical protein